MAATGLSGRDRPGILSVLFVILSAVAPLVVLAAVIPLTFARTGNTALPLAFGGLGIVLLLFSVGYLAMSRHIPNTGSLYAYVAQGLGRPSGLGAAWLALVAYSALHISLYGLVGAAANLFLDRAFGVPVAWWIVALVALVLVTSNGVIQIRLRGRIVALLACLELATVVGFVVVVGGRGPDAGSGVSMMDPHQMLAVGFGAALVPSLFAFAGFETATVFAETSRDPRRAVAAGTYLSVLVVAVVGAAAAWGLATAAGTGAVVTESAATAVPQLPFRLADASLPGLVVTAGSALLVTSVLGALMASQDVLTRYVYALRRERVPQGTLGGHGRGARRVGVLVLAVLALVGIVLGAVLRIDPVRYFFWLGMAGSYGLLVLLTLTSLSVVTYFGRDARGENVARRLLAPAMATALLGAVVVMAGGEFGLLIGLDDRWSWGIPAAVGCVVLLGAAWAFLERAWHPHRYESIGLGPNSVTGVPIQDRVTRSPHAAAHSAAPTSSAPARGPSGSSAPGRHAAASIRPWGD